MEDPIARIEVQEPAPDYDSGSGTDVEYDIPDIHDVIKRLDDVTSLSSGGCDTCDRDVASTSDRDVASDGDCSLTDSSTPSEVPESETGSVGATSNSDSFTLNPFMEDNGIGENDLPVQRRTCDVVSSRKHVTIESKRGSVGSPRELSRLSSGGKNSRKSDGEHSVKRFLKRLSGKLSDNPSESSAQKFADKMPSKLPQMFVVKYLGRRECAGLRGIKYLRKPVDELAKSVTEQLDATVKSVELPLVYAIVSHKGVDLRPHKNSKVPIDTLTHFPIDFISYGVQDVKFSRIFTFIVVQEMSSRSKKLECHALICDSPHAARMLALSLAAAFRVYMEQLESQGKQHRFEVELRTLEDPSQGEEDC